MSNRHIYACTLVSGVVVIGEVLDFSPLVLRSPFFVSVIPSPHGADRVTFSRLAPYARPDAALDRSVQLDRAQYLGTYRVSEDLEAAYLEAVTLRNREAVEATGEQMESPVQRIKSAPGFEKG